MDEQTAVKIVGGALRAIGYVAPGTAARLALRLFSSPRRHARPEREREVMVTGRPFTVGPGLSATEWGAGPAVLLVHGWEGRGTQLGAFVQPLVDAGRRVIALDGPAHGDSPGRGTDLLKYADALRDIGRELGPLDGVVAHSFGVAATVHAMADGLDVAKVVMIAGPSSVHDVLSRYEAMMGLTPAVARRFRELATRRVGRNAHELHVGEAARGLGKVRALIVHDPEDAEVPYADALELSAAWPGARLLTVHGEGHRRILRAPEVVRAAVAFLTGDVGETGPARAQAGEVGVAR
ncbi:MAG TPA: alpha/beta fold hydrolase [Longimicrobiaceae bacterium]|jgi:pimeloyl-ACP methyl ester carboxylesterase|nr:alpha/beta fold hydrolase [Longimicrobiaceae bacterium]